MISQRNLVLVAASLVLTACIAGTAGADQTMELKQTIDLGKGKAGSLDHLALDAKRDRLFVANKTNNTLDIVDLKAGKLLKQVRNQGGIQGIAYAADVDRVIVGLGAGGYCNFFDGQDYKLLETRKFADDSDNVRYDPRTHLVYVAHADKSLGVLDVKTYELKTDIKLPGAAEGFQIEKGRPRLYVNIPSPSEVVVIDTDKNTVLQHHKVEMAGGQHPMALDEANHRIYLGCRKKPMVVIMDTESGKEIGGADIPGDVDDLFLDAKNKRLYASCGDGAIAVLKLTSPDKLEAAEKIETPKGSKTSYFDTETGRFFLAIPRQTGKEGPEIRVYQVRP
jgi:DNA-binding beta-propeller fold protein YncE